MDLHITNDPHFGCFHHLDRPALAFLVKHRTGEDPVAVTVLLDPRPAFLLVPSPTPTPHLLENPVIHVRKSALDRLTPTVFVTLAACAAALLSALPGDSRPCEVAATTVSSSCATARTDPSSSPGRSAIGRGRTAGWKI